MPPKPSTPHADEILQNYWEDQLEPAELVRRSVALGKLAAELTAVSEDGQVGALQLLNYGQGLFASTVSAGWTQFFIKVGFVATQIGQAAACMSEWATTLGTMLAEMGAVVGWAEAAIASIESQRPVLIAAGQDPEQMIQAILTDAKSQVAAVSAAATSALTPPPPWAGAVTGLKAPSTNSGASSQSSQNESPGTPTKTITDMPGTTRTKEIGNPTKTESDAPASTRTKELGNPSTTLSDAPANSTSQGGGGSVGQASGAGTASSASGNAASGGGSATPTSGSSPASASQIGSHAGAGNASSSAGASPGTASSAASSPSASGSPSSSSSASSAGSASGQGGGGSNAPTTSTAHAGAGSGSAASSGAAPAEHAPAASPVAPLASVSPAMASSAMSAPGAAPLSAAASAPVTQAPVAPMAASPVAPIAAGSGVAPPAPAVSAPPAASAVAASAGAAPTAAAAGAAPAAAVAGAAAPAATTTPASSQTPAASSGSQQHRGPDGSPGAGPGTGTFPAGVSGAGPAEMVPPEQMVPPLVLPVDGFVSQPVSPLVPPLNEDLVALQTIVEAAGGGADVGWAAGTVETGAVTQVVVSTDRGRSWIPARALLPADVVLPWFHDNASRWDGLRHPARVIVEYAHSVGGRLTALVSTHSSAPAVAAGVPWAIAKSSAVARPELVGGPMVTRFELQVPADRRKAVTAIVDPVLQREQALWLAYAANDLAEPSVVRSRLIETMRAHVDRLSHPRWLAGLGWDDLIAEHRELNLRERAARIDVRDIPVGQVDTSGDGMWHRRLLAKVFAAESVLAVSHPTADGAVRDAVYGWTMLLQTPTPTPPVSPIHAIPAR